MEPGVNAGPPVLLERALLSLVPPLVREELAGDLWERYRSQPQYVAETARILPYIVWSQARRATDMRLFLLLALSLLVALGGLEPNRTPLQTVPIASQGIPIAWRALVAALPALGALLLRNAYRPSESWTAARAIGDVAWLLIALVASQVVLALLGVAGLIDPTWRLPLGWLLGGGSFSAVVMLLLRSELEITNTGLRTGRLGADPAGDFHVFRRNVRLRSAFETVAPALLAGFLAWTAFHARPIVIAIFGGWAVVTGLVLIVRLRDRARPAAQEDIVVQYLAELEQQREARRWIWWWHFVPLFAGISYNTIAFGVATRQLDVVIAGAGACVTLAAMLVRLAALRKERLSAKIAQLRPFALAPPG